MLTSQNGAHMTARRAKLDLEPTPSHTQGLHASRLLVTHGVWSASPRAARIALGSWGFQLAVEGQAMDAGEDDIDLE